MRNAARRDRHDAARRRGVVDAVADRAGGGAVRYLIVLLLLSGCDFVILKIEKTDVVRAKFLTMEKED